MWLCARWSLSLYGRQIEDKDEMSSSLTHRTFIHTLDQERYKFHLFLIENTWVKCVCINEDICLFLNALFWVTAAGMKTHTQSVLPTSLMCVLSHWGTCSIEHGCARSMNTNNRTSFMLLFLIDITSVYILHWLWVRSSEEKKRETFYFSEVITS